MQTIPLSEITLGERSRATNEDHVAELAESIREQGLIQPIVLRRSDKRIIAGGHRYAAFTILATNTDIPEDERKQYENIPFLYFDEYLVQAGKLEEGQHISDSQLMVLEMEENLRRLDMTWQEKCIGIYRYHKEQVKESRKVNITWMQETTGSMLGLSQASVSQNIKIGTELVANPQSALFKCESLADAIRFKVAQRLDAATRHRANRIRQRSLPEKGFEAEDEGQASPEQLQAAERAGSPQAEAPTASDGRAFSLELISSLFRVGDFREKLPLIAEEHTIDHIICDPPYGIDMKNLDQFDAIDRIEDTHQVEPNKKLLVDLLDVGYKCLSESGFMCLWYDLDLHDLLQTTAKKIGWKVCRWPLVWCKTTPCRNSAAQYNFTKSTEVCMILRRSEKAVLVEKQSNNYILAPAISSKTHPFVKPFDVWERLISAVSFKNQMIVDPFAGEGSCLSAAIRLERFALGCEIEQRHVDQAIGQLDKELNKTSQLLHEMEDETPF